MSLYEHVLDRFWCPGLGMFRMSLYEHVLDRFWCPGLDMYRMSLYEHVLDRFWWPGLGMRQTGKGRRRESLEPWRDGGPDRYVRGSPSGLPWQPTCQA